MPHHARLSQGLWSGEAGLLCWRNLQAAAWAAHEKGRDIQKGCPFLFCSRCRWGSFARCKRLLRQREGPFGEGRACGMPLEGACRYLSWGQCVPCGRGPLAAGGNAGRPALRGPRRLLVRAGFGAWKGGGLFLPALRQRPLWLLIWAGQATLGASACRTRRRPFLWEHGHCENPSAGFAALDCGKLLAYGIL